MHNTLPSDGERRSLVPPIPELDVAAGHMSAAVQAFLDGDSDRAREHLRSSDMPVLSEYAGALMSRRNPELFRRRIVDARRLDPKRLEVRMPPMPVRRAVFARDGWRCRFCNTRVVQPDARDRLRALLPGAIRWGEADGYHGGLYALTATPDHVVPHSLGGTNEMDNLVTACWPCNFGKGHDTVEELAIADPRARPPLVDGWDGLTAILRRPAPRASAIGKRSGKSMMSGAPLAWAEHLNRLEPTLANRLVSFAASCAPMGVSYAVDKVMVLRLPTREGLINPIGIDPEWGVFIPWQIGGWKAEFRAFAEALAEAIPNAVAYETPKSWSVRLLHVGGKRSNLSFSDLLGASDQIRAALADLVVAVGKSPTV